MSANVVTVDGIEVIAEPFAGRARPVGRYAIYLRDGEEPKIGEAVRCDQHPERFTMYRIDGGRVDILESATRDDGCVRLSDGMREMIREHQDHEEPER